MHAVRSRRKWPGEQSEQLGDLLPSMRCGTARGFYRGRFGMLNRSAWLAGYQLNQLGGFSSISQNAAKATTQNLYSRIRFV